MRLPDEIEAEVDSVLTRARNDIRAFNLAYRDAILKHYPPYVRVTSSQPLHPGCTGLPPIQLYFTDEGQGIPYACVHWDDEQWRTYLDYVATADWNLRRQLAQQEFRSAESYVAHLEALLLAAQHERDEKLAALQRLKV